VVNKLTLAEKILDYRARNKTSQLNLAKMVGVTQVTIAKIENGGKFHAVTERKILNVIEKE
jgi:DNA-binding XRE family transcriptional regulator